MCHYLLKIFPDHPNEILIVMIFHINLSLFIVHLAFILTYISCLFALLAVTRIETLVGQEPHPFYFTTMSTTRKCLVHSRGSVKITERMKKESIIQWTLGAL